MSKQARGLVKVNGTEPQEYRSKESLQAEIVIMRAKGVPISTIAKKLGMGRNTVKDWALDLEAEIAQARALELEALYEQAYLAKEKRIKFLAGLIRTMEKELKSRDLSEVSTDRLITLMLSAYGELKEEYIDPKLVRTEDLEDLRD